MHVAGWMGDDPQTGQIVEGGIEAQTVILTGRASIELGRFVLAGEVPQQWA